MNTTINSLPFELELKQEIEKFGQLVVLPKGQFLAEEGKYTKQIPLLLSGKIRVYKTDPELDREILLYYVRQGETCIMSVFSIYNDIKSSVNGVVTENSEVLLIPIQKVRAWQLRYSTWNRYIINGFEQRYSNLLDVFKAISFRKIDERLEDFLRTYSQDHNTQVIPFSHQQLANELGTTRVVISRILKTMENQNVLSLHRGYIRLNPA